MRQTFDVQTVLPTSYLHWPAEPSMLASSLANANSADANANTSVEPNSPDPAGLTGTKLVIFLHGYTDSASSFLKRSWPDRAPEYEVLAPNGPFPVPVKTETGYKDAYAWYFVDSALKRVVIPPTVPVEILVKLVQHLKLEFAHKVIVGFSQGGLLAPLLAQKLTGVQRIIGVGTAFRSSDYEGLSHLPVDAIHGDQDTILTLDSTRKGLEGLAHAGFATHLSVVYDLAHTLNDEARSILKERVRLGFAAKRK